MWKEKSTLLYGDSINSAELSHVILNTSRLIMDSRVRASTSVKERGESSSELADFELTQISSRSSDHVDFGLWEWVDFLFYFICSVDTEKERFIWSLYRFARFKEKHTQWQIAWPSRRHYWLQWAWFLSIWFCTRVSLFFDRCFTRESLLKSCTSKSVGSLINRTIWPMCGTRALASGNGAMLDCAIVGRRAVLSRLTWQGSSFCSLF